MSRNPVKYVNVIPQAKIKKEFKEDDEVSVQCKICNKTFVTDTALNNHARMEHMDVFATGDRTKWMEPYVKPVYSSPPVVVKKEKSNMSAASLLSSMGPTSLMSLASKDVSYILIKAEPQDIKERKRKGEKVNPQTGEKVARRDKDKDKEPQPITGPFECLQPSTLVADGTCHQIFFSCCEYSAHCRDEHTRRRKGTRCQVCEKPLAGAGDTQAPYPCDVCGAGFQTNKELSEHMATDHIKLKPFECSVCHKRFTQQGGVQQHMRMHTGDRPFPCTFCPKAFTQKSGLDQHLRIHTKVKPYRCIICSKTFCQSVHLKQHMRTHTNVSPFQCGICSKRFKQSSHLNYHLKNHNPAVMSNEQKAEYHKLLAMMPKEDTKVNKQNVICIQGENGSVEYLEVNDEEIQCDEVAMEAEVLLDDQESQDQDEEELILAESSIQDGDTYILSDNNSEEVWSVKLVGNDSE